jgi:hypothetical protein
MPATILALASRSARRRKIPSCANPNGEDTAILQRAIRQYGGPTRAPISIPVTGDSSPAHGHAAEVGLTNARPATSRLRRGPGHRPVWFLPDTRAPDHRSRLLRSTRPGVQSTRSRFRYDVRWRTARAPPLRQTLPHRASLAAVCSPPSPRSRRTPRSPPAFHHPRIRVRRALIAVHTTRPRPPTRIEITRHAGPRSLAQAHRFVERVASASLPRWRFWPPCRVRSSSRRSATNNRESSRHGPVDLDFLSFSVGPLAPVTWLDDLPVRPLCAVFAGDETASGSRTRHPPFTPLAPDARRPPSTAITAAVFGGGRTTVLDRSGLRVSKNGDPCPGRREPPAAGIPPWRADPPGRAAGRHAITSAPTAPRWQLKSRSGSRCTSTSSPPRLRIVGPRLVRLSGGTASRRPPSPSVGTAAVMWQLALPPGSPRLITDLGPPPLEQPSLRLVSSLHVCVIQWSAEWVKRSAAAYRVPSTRRRECRL